MKRFVFFTCLVIAAYSCALDNVFTPIDKEPVPTKPLEIITKSLTGYSLNFTQAFSEGVEFGLFVYSAQSQKIYKDREEYKNVKAQAIREDGKICWRKEPEVWLDAEPATILAYAPYQKDSEPDARQIPVRISPDATQTAAYMYGTHALGHKKVNHLSPMVLLTMNYALSQIVFRVAGEKQAGGNLFVSRVEIGNEAGGTLLFNEGVLDITTGKITPQPGTDAPTRLRLAKPLRLTGEYQSLPGLKLFPTPRQAEQGEIEALFTINGKTYSFSFPENTRWKKGHMYTYQLFFNGNSLRFEKMDTSDWIPGKKNYS